MNDPIILRAKIREALALRPRDSLSEGMLKTVVERLLGERVTVPEFQAALEWNHGGNLIESEWSADAEANFWGLTKKGKTKEGVK